MCNCNPYGKAEEALAVQRVGTTQIDTLLLTVSIIYSQSLFVFNQVRSTGDAHHHHQLTQVMSSSSGVISSSSVKQSSSSGKLPSGLGGRTVILL
jgi:multidrug resistance efflux pump